MKLKLIDIIEELSYWQNNGNIAQIVTVEDIKDPMLARVMNLDGIKPETRILIFSDEKSVAYKRQKNDELNLAFDVALDRLPKEFKGAEIKKEYILHYFPIDVCDQFELNEDNNIRFESKHNRTIIGRLVKKNQPKTLVVDDNIARKIIVKDAHPIPYGPLSSLVQILLSHSAYLDSFSRGVLIDSIDDYCTMRYKSNSYSASQKKEKLRNDINEYNQKYDKTREKKYKNKYRGKEYENKSREKEYENKSDNENELSK